MPNILEPNKFLQRNGVAQIENKLHIVSWCCGTTIERAGIKYSCAICGRKLETGGEREQGFWVTFASMVSHMDGHECEDWISAWTGIPQEQLTIKITHE